MDYKYSKLKDNQKLSQNGATMVEYALLIAIMALGMIVGIQAVQQKVLDNFLYYSVNQYPT